MARSQSVEYACFDSNELAYCNATTTHRLSSTASIHVEAVHMQLCTANVCCLSVSPHLRILIFLCLYLIVTDFSLTSLNKHGASYGALRVQGEAVETSTCEHDQ